MGSISCHDPGDSGIIPHFLWLHNLEANPIFHACMEHMDIDSHFIHDMVARKDLEVQSIASND